jgi:hypothetical protein
MMAIQSNAALFVKKVPKKFWVKFNNQREYMDWIGKQLNVEHLDQWYNISQVHYNKK